MYNETAGALDIHVSHDLSPGRGTTRESIVKTCGMDNYISHAVHKQVSYREYVS